MSHYITVKDVQEVHNCAGVKHILVYPEDSPSPVKYAFKMYTGYMPVEHKLCLSTVDIGDVVEVNTAEDFFNPNVVGEFYNITNSTYNRLAKCRCGSSVLSDGYKVYCSNTYCPMTIAARISRLATTPFFSQEVLEETSLFLNDKNNPFLITGLDTNYDKPFALLLDTKFWGIHNTDLSQVLLKHRHILTNATFLISSEFKDFIDSTWFSTYPDHFEFRPISKFYDEMAEFIHRRDYTSPRQNRLIREFIWSLGIEALTLPMVDSLVKHETLVDMVDDPILAYVLCLTSRGQLIHELGLHPLEADGVYQEVVSRRYEFFDIFAEYSDRETIAEVFKYIIPK